jgi:hypothetical protein
MSRPSSGEGEKLISGEEVLGIWSMCVTETEKFFPCGTTRPIWTGRISDRWKGEKGTSRSYSFPQRIHPIFHNLSYICQSRKNIPFRGAKPVKTDCTYFIISDYLPFGKTSDKKSRPSRRGRRNSPGLLRLLPQP